MRSIGFVLFLIVSLHSSAQKDSTFILKGGLYFPLESLSPLRNIWYSEILSSNQEPVIYKGSSGKAVFRFLSVGWSKNQVIRIEKNSVSAILFVKRGKSDFSIDLTEKEWNKLKRKVKRSKYWKEPTVINHHGKDGYHWILEASENGNYHVVDRWVPKSSRYKGLGKYIIQLSKQ